MGRDCLQFIYRVDCTTAYRHRELFLLKYGIKEIVPEDGKLDSRIYETIVCFPSSTKMLEKIIPTYVK